MRAATTPAFVGREPELELLRGALEAASTGEPRVVLVEGPPGIGKTALLRRFLAEAGDGVRVLRATGEESEALLAYGVAEQLMRSARLPLPDSLSSLGTSAAAKLEPVSVGAGLLELVGALQQDGTVVMVIDDAQWADNPSLLAVLFALRRLFADRVLAVVAARVERTHHFPEGLLRLSDTDRGQRLLLRGLEVEDLEDLGASVTGGRLPRGFAERLHEHTEGNPLHTRALLEEMPLESLRSRDLPMPSPEAFSTLVLSRLAGCATETQGLVVGASVLGMQCSLGAAARLAGTPEPLSALEEAVTARLLEPASPTDVRHVRFPHALVRSAVYYDLGPALRAALHTRAADLVDDQASWLRHRVAAAPGEDPALAADLAIFARSASDQGAWASAAASLTAAARLSPQGENRRTLVLKAVDALLYAGDVPQAASLADGITPAAGDAYANYVLGRLALFSGRQSVAQDLLIRAWGACDMASERELGATIAHELTSLFYARTRGSETVEWARRTIEAAEGTPFVRRPLGFLGVGLGMTGRAAEGFETFAFLPDRIVDPDADEVYAICGRGHLRMFADDLEGARADHAAADKAFVRWGPLTVRLGNLGFLSTVEYRLGAWDDATVHAELGVSLAKDADQVWVLSFLHATAVAPLAGRGEWDAAAAHAEASMRFAVAVSKGFIASAAMAQAQLAAARNDHQGVVDALEPMHEIRKRADIDEPGNLWPWRGLYTDALVGLGRPDDAEAVLAPFEELAADRRRYSALANTSRVRGNLEAARGRNDEAEAAFLSGLAHSEKLGLPFDRARLEYAYGAFLRRRGRRTAAIDQLRGASERFAALRARPYLDRCSRELAACGSTPARRRGADGAHLTAQELSVARLVSSGMSNPKVAAELFVSINTVEFHLKNVYGKLGIRSRDQLAEKMATA